jgi:LuxR family maltose regulon positive regulatory protein
VGIDDAHHLADSQALPVLQRLIDEAPENVCLLVTTCAPLDLRVAELILHDAIVVLDERAIAFDHDEFTTFLRTAKFDSLDPELLSSIERLTGGWIAGIRLLTHHYKYSGGRPFLSSDARPNAPLTQFFRANVLGALTAQEVHVLAISALLPGVDSPLLAAVTGSDEAECAHLLEKIAQRALLTADLSHDATQVTYRLHRLLRDFFNDVRTLSPAQRDEVIRTAAAWMIERDRIDDALGVLDDAGIEFFADPLAVRMRAALLRYDLEALQRWLQRLPTALLERHAPLAVVAAWTACFAISADFAAALQRAERATQDCGLAELRAETLALRGMHQMSSGATSTLIPLIAQLAPLAENSMGLAAGYLSAFRGWASADTGSVDAHVRAIQHAADIFERIGFHYGALEMTVSVGFVKRRIGNALGAIHSLRSAENILENSRWNAGAMAITVQCALGEQLYLTNRIEQARSRLDNAERIHAQSSPLPEFGYFAALLNQLCDLADGRSVTPGPDDVTAWNATLQCPLPQTIGMVAAARILRDFRRGAPQNCRHTIEQMGIQPGQLNAEHPDSIWLAVLSGAVLGGRTDASLAALLDRAEARCHAENFLAMALQVRVLRVLYEQARGDDDRALTSAAALLQDIERTGLHRVALDFPGLIPLLRRSGTAFANLLRTQMRATDSEAATAFALSAQELRIVHMLLDDLSPEDAALRLALSIETIRSHLRRIYRKMNVHSRAEMMQAARAAGLHRRDSPSSGG